MRKQKVVPVNNSSTIPSLSDDEEGRREEKEDSFLHNAVQEIDRITQEAESLTKDLLSSYSNDQVIPNLYWQANPPIRTNNKPNSKRNTNSKNQQQQQQQPEEEDNEVEEIKLSHEIHEDERHGRIGQELDQSFALLKQQVEEYRKLYTKTNERLKEVENKRHDLENKLETTLDDKVKLQEEINQLKQQQQFQGQGGPGSHGGGPLGSFYPPLGGPHQNNRNRGMMNDDLLIQHRMEELRKALFMGDNEDENNNFNNNNNPHEIISFLSDEFWKQKDWIRSLRNMINFYIPFKRDIRKIQSRFGSAVASYFLFFRFLFLQVICAAIISILFFVLHANHFSESHSNWKDFFSSPGYLPQIMMYSSYTSEEGLNYDLSVLFIATLSFFLLAWKLIEEDKFSKELEAIEEENAQPYAKQVLCSWDFAIRSEMDAEDYKGSLGNKLLQQLEETHASGLKEGRSSYQTFLIYCRRIGGLLLYLCVLLTSFIVILIVTFYSDHIAKEASSVPGVSNIQSFITPIILNMISSLMPMIAKFITALECWDSPTTITQINLLRVYISSLLNALLLVLSYVVLADPMLLANYPSIRKSFGLRSSDSYPCRMDQVADGLFTVVVFTWLLNNFTLFIMPYINMLLAYLRGKAYKKSEFLIADNMVKKLNLMGQIYAVSPFCPLVFLFIPIMLALGFKWEKWVIQRLYSKPDRMFSGQKAGLMNTLAYLCTFLVIGIATTAYFLTTKTFAKECDIQDHHIHLCQSGSFDNTTNQCNLDSSSEYYQFYKNTKYPATICNQACGPFLYDSNNMSPFHYRVSRLFIMQYVWMICFDYPYVPWTIMLILALWIGRNKNSLEVLRFSSYTKYRSMEARLFANEAERKKQEKMIKKFKTIGNHTTSNEGDDEDDEASVVIKDKTQ